MILENLFQDKPLYTDCHCKKSTTGSDVSVPLTQEHILNLYVNGEQVNTFTCSPAQLAELCIGWLLSEGYLSTPEDLLQLRISTDGLRADAQTGVKRSADSPPAFSRFHAANPALIAKAADLLQSDTTVHAHTHGTHGCVLADENGTITLLEDIGRYNAADKAIGYAVLRQADRARCILFSSGRVPEGMVYKMARCGIPVLVSRAAATVQALEAARKFNLTLCFFTRKDSFLQDKAASLTEGGINT